ncbi:hypothetical protein L484_013231 [Morus notabilis]|uniref:Uncharacterized protein n=1 Tax=Morus notabilis TaxID=981085 RepID=W9SSM4_9ROSA|nr:hypothetical protein L484_013231 [Morus notabilis]
MHLGFLSVPAAAASIVDTIVIADTNAILAVRSPVTFGAGGRSDLPPKHLHEEDMEDLISGDRSTVQLCSVGLLVDEIYVLPISWRMVPTARSRLALCVELSLW